MELGAEFSQLEPQAQSKVTVLGNVTGFETEQMIFGKHLLQPTSTNGFEKVPTVDQVFKSQDLLRTFLIISTVVIESVGNFNKYQ